MSSLICKRDFKCGKLIELYCESGEEIKLLVLISLLISVLLLNECVVKIDIYPVNLQTDENWHEWFYVFVCILAISDNVLNLIWKLKQKTK